MATPGMQELLSIGKVWELAQLERRRAVPRPTISSSSTRPPPATASASCTRRERSPRSPGSVRSRGRRERSRRRSPTATSPRHGRRAPRGDGCGRDPLAQFRARRRAADARLVVLNAVYPDRFDDDEIAALSEALPSASSASGRSALTAAVSEHARARSQRLQAASLREQLTAPIVTLPHLFADQIGLPELERLADALARRWRRLIQSFSPRRRPRARRPASPTRSRRR